MLNDELISFVISSKLLRLSYDDVIILIKDKISSIRISEGLFITYSNYNSLRYIHNVKNYYELGFNNATCSRILNLFDCEERNYLAKFKYERFQYIAKTIT